MTRKNIVFVLALIIYMLLTNLYTSASEPKTGSIAPEDQAFLNNIINTLISAKGYFEHSPKPFVNITAGNIRFDRAYYSGDKSIFIRLGKIIDKHPEVAHQTISTLVDHLDDMRATGIIYNNKPVPLGIMCYQALQSFCTYEATDEDGAVTGWDGHVSPGATEEDLKTAKKAWMKVLQEKTYMLL